MTLTAALRAALATPSDLAPIRAIVAHVVTDPADAQVGLVARVLLFGFAPFTTENGRLLAAEMPQIIMVCVNAGASLDDFRTVINEPAVAPEIPRSAEWTAAAERLAAWADGQTTPEEPAPWDEPTVMSDEDIAALVGL